MSRLSVSPVHALEDVIAAGTDAVCICSGSSVYVVWTGQSRVKSGGSLATRVKQYRLLNGTSIDL